MRLLLDECVPRRLKQELLGHDAKTVQDMYQQNLAGLMIGVVVMVAASNDVDDLRPLLSGVVEVLVVLQPGEIVRVGA